MEHETQKLKELDEGYAQELKEWKLQLKPRKQVSKKNDDSLSWFIGRHVTENVINMDYGVDKYYASDKYNFQLASWKVWVLILICLHWGSE